MSRYSLNFKLALLVLSLVALIMAVPFEEDTEAAQAVADDVSEAQHAEFLLMAEREACKALRGPDAQVYLLNGEPLVCRAAAVTTVVVQP
ncbi:MAG: hypothetical protein V4772_08860 [Pseudomonadota bacterium]